jgi:hypothetical protein
VCGVGFDADGAGSGAEAGFDGWHATDDVGDGLSVGEWRRARLATTPTEAAALLRDGVRKALDKIDT